MDLELKGKRVFITASSGGIGLATAEAFLHEGAHVIINGRDEDRLCSEKERLEKDFGSNVEFFCGDMSDREDIFAVVEFIKKRFGALDIFVANLGSGRPELSNQLEESEWRRFYNINVSGTVELLNRLYTTLRLGKNPCVTLLSSVIARGAASAPVGYAAAKSSIRILGKYLSRMWAEDGIRVNCILPGNIYFTRGRWEELLRNDPDGVEMYIKSSVPMKRFGRAEEIADAIVFISSARAGFITGAELVVDGGQSVTI